MKLSAIIFSAFVAMTAVVIADVDSSAASDVVVLTDNSYDKFVSESKVALIEFYAPWCGHCKHLAPEYEVAATELKKDGVLLAKVDCTDNEKVCASQGIRGYPTLKVHNAGAVKDYEGPRDAAGIVKYMKRQTMPDISEVTLAEAESLGREHGVAIFGIFTNDDDGKKQSEVFANLAKEMRNEHVFATVKPGIYMVKSFDEGSAVFSGAAPNDPAPSIATPEGEAALRKWIGVESTPLMDEIGPDNYAKYMASGLPMAYLFYKKDEMRKEYGSIVEDLIRAYKGRLNAVYIDAEKFDGHARALTLPADSWPGFVIHEPEADLKFPFTEKQITRDSLSSFLESYSQGKLQPAYRSQEIPEKDDGAVKTIVYKNFSDVVLSGKHDVLLEIYAPWCGACRRIASTYEKVAQAFAAHSDKIIIAKMDGTENDLPREAGVNLTKFPTIILFKAGKKGQVEMERPSDSTESFFSFIKEHATNKVDPVIPEESQKSKDVSSENSLDRDEL